MRGPARARTGLLLLSVTLAGCGVQQRAAESLIDPQLHANGVLVERQPGSRDLALGRYRVVEHSTTATGLGLGDDPAAADTPLAADEHGRTRPSAQVRMHFELVGGEQNWTTDCVGQRRQPPDADFAAIADELRDEVALKCEVSNGELRWMLELDGDLGANLHGRLYPVGAPAEAKRVDVIMWRRLWNITKRRLPAALATLKANDTTEAALILDTPERAWIDPKLDDASRELDLCALLALRLLPLGFDE